MSFQTGLSGLNAAARNLDVIGNNIANANTTGMKASRAEFSGLVSSALSSASSGGAGIGVEVANVAQLFTQGNISTTNNNLDVAINGSGFFQLTQTDGTPAYTRDGSFKLNTDGYLVTNTGANLMGYPTDATGKATSITIEKLQLPTSAPIAASATSEITAEFNLDARAVIAATAPGVTASLTTPTITNFNFANVPATPTNSVASGMYTQATSTPNTDAFQFKIDGVVVSDNVVTAATAAKLDSDLTTWLGTTAGAGYTKTGSFATNNLVINKTDGTDMVIATSFSSGVGVSGGAGTTGGGTFANAIVGTHTGGTPAITRSKTFTAVGPAGTAATFNLTTDTANMTGLLAAIRSDSEYLASGLTVTANASNQLVFTASSPNTAGNITVSGTDAGFLTTGSSSVAGVTRTATVPTPRATYGTSLTAYDSQGVELPVNLYFTRVAPTTAGTDEWAVYDSLTSSSPVGSLVFDNDGQLIRSSVGALTLTPAAPSTVPPFPVTVDFSKVSQFGSAFAVSNLTQDGYAAGELTGINIGDDGIITASYSNGQTQAAGQLALADFRNIQGLEPLGGNAWARTNESGLPVQGAPGNGKFGLLRSGALEESNVDLTKELVDMMTAQRAYQANAQTIKTQDQIMSTLVNLR